MFRNLRTYKRLTVRDDYAFSASPEKTFDAWEIVTDASQIGLLPGQWPSFLRIQNEQRQEVRLECAGNIIMGEELQGVKYQGSAPNGAPLRMIVWSD